MTLSGRVVTGLGQGASFTRLDWAREQFIKGLGIDPYAGTVNLFLDSAEDLERWEELKSGSGYLVIPPTDEFCNARCYPVKINGMFPGAVVFPEVPGYPEGQVEVIAALSLRRSLSIKDGDRLTLQISMPIPVSTVIFDVDGTLVDSIEAYRVAANRVTALHEFGGIFNGLDKTLSLINKMGKRMAIVTGSGEESLNPLHDSCMIDYFEAVITGMDVEKQKPDPEGLLKCLSILKVNPENAVYVGDTTSDVKAARAAGVASVALLTGAGNSEQLSLEEPDRIIYSHAGLPEILVGFYI